MRTSVSGKWAESSRWSWSRWWVGSLKLESPQHWSGGPYGVCRRIQWDCPHECATEQKLVRVPLRFLIQWQNTKKSNEEDNVWFWLKGSEHWVHHILTWGIQAWYEASCSAVKPVVKWLYIWWQLQSPQTAGPIHNFQHHTKWPSSYN